MILIVNEKSEDCRAFDAKLGTHYPSDCACFNKISIRQIKRINPGLIVMVCRRVGEKGLGALNLIKKANLGVPIVLFGCAEAKLPPAFGDLVILNAAGFSELIGLIGMYEPDSLNWDDRIAAIQKYIRENIRNIHTAGDIPKELCLHPRRLRFEFKKRTGKTIQQFIMDARLEAIRSILLATLLEEASCFALALEFGYSNDSSIHTFIQTHTGFSLSDYHRKLLEANKLGT